MAYPALFPGRIPSVGDMSQCIPQLLEAVQSIYDQWEQNDNGFDEAYGGGGICHDIADSIVNVLGRFGVENAMSIQASVGENHVFVVALFEDGIYSIDIPASVYETGGGYVWNKKDDVVFSSADISVSRIDGPTSPDDFFKRFAD